MRTTNGPNRWDGETLRRTLATASCEPSDGPAYFPHHPLACDGPLHLYTSEMSLACRHLKTEPEDSRTRSAINHSVALLIAELATQL